MARIGIVDYGMGNLVSVAGAIEALGHEPLVAPEPRVLDGAERIVLPGVGAFGDAMRNLAARGFVDAFDELVRHRRRPILGICLGAQLLARDSEEFGPHRGLGWIAARVERLRPADAERLPHVGWNGVAKRKESALLRGVPDDALFYYVHSYCIAAGAGPMVVAECDYGQGFAAVVEQDNIFGTQFHPEKSQRHGLAVLRNFLEAC